MGRIDRETVDRILATADIVDVVSDFVKLRRSGANYKGLCPFHNERTPSFSVNKARNICKCFSCGKGGSPVNFIMELEQLSYNEALRYLARKYNIEIVEREQTDQERQAQNERESMIAVNDFAQKQFRHNLLDTAEGRDIALAYFRHRGLSDAMIERFQLGYSLDRPGALTEAATAAGFSSEYLVKTGLAGVSERDGKQHFYDRFRGRVMFPIFSISGRVIAFGGRTMRSDKTLAKYVNSPESVIYKKNLELYGLYQAKTAIARRDKCIMVEGYLDVISMHQAGVENVVASSGTSLTEGQIRAIRRFTNNVTLIYDADAAGIKASLRGINMLLAEKMDVRVLLLPPGDDPDSFAQSHSSSEVERYLAENEHDIIAFMTEVLLRDIPAGDPMGRAKAVNTILGSVAQIDDPVKRQEYISQCSRMLSIPEDVLVRQLNILLAGRYEEAEKNAARELARQSLQGADDQPERSDSTAEAPLINLADNRLKPYEKMLARYLVRYGLLYFVDVDQPDGTKVPFTVYQIIAAELAEDGYRFSDPAYAALFDEIGRMFNGPWSAEREQRRAEIEREIAAEQEARREELRRTAGSVAEIQRAEREMEAKAAVDRVERLNQFDLNYVQSRLVNSPDDAVRRTASELVVDRYTLSRMYIRQGNVESEQDQLPTLVIRAIAELRNAVVTGILADLTERLSALSPADASQAADLLRQIADYKSFQRHLSSNLGDRIILPRR